MCNKIIKFLIGSLTLTTLLACHNSPTQRKITIGKRNATSSNTCTNDVYKFAKALNIDTSKTLNNYLNMMGEMENCDFKADRKKFQMQVSITLIILKINNYHLLRGHRRVLAYPISGISKFSSQIIHTYAFEYYKKEVYFEESLFIDDVIDFVKSRPDLLEVKEINQEYRRFIKIAQTCIKGKEITNFY